MSCLTVTMDRIGGAQMSAEIIPAPRLRVLLATKRAELTATVVRPAMCVRITRTVTRMSVVLEPVCKSGLSGPYLAISPTTINLTAAGTAVSVAVSSNTSWTIS